MTTVLLFRITITVSIHNPKRWCVLCGLKVHSLSPDLLTKRFPLKEITCFIFHCHLFKLPLPLPKSNCTLTDWGRNSLREIISFETPWAEKSKRAWNPILNLTFACSTGARARNDPSAGSPTKTLLRLLLPLSIMDYQSFLDQQRFWFRSEQLAKSLYW